MKKERKENIILIAGFVLIIIVILFTLFRNKLSFKTNKSTPGVSDLINNKLILPYETINVSDLNKKILLSGDKEKFVLLDIRPFDLYINEHIVDSINISINEFPIGSKIDTKSPIIVIGESNVDKDISIAVEKLKQENFKDITVLAGGIALWKQLIGATVTYGDPKSFVDQSKVSYLDPQALNDALNQKVPVFIVDVRSPDEYAKGHIVGAKNIPIDDLEKRRKEITEKRVIVVGDNELQEFQASVQMYDMLLISPFVMRTAMPGWQAKGFSLVK